MDPLGRYALALSLLPDEDTAGEIFMEATDEVDLRRKAARWLARHGLPSAGAGPVPVLTEAQEEHALHLWRRGRRRRVLRFGLTGMGILVLTIAMLLWGWRQPRGLAANPVYQRTPVANLNDLGHRTLAIHRMLRDRQYVTVWWSLSGPGAAAARLKISVDMVGEPFFAETSAVNRNLLVGRSTYHSPVYYVKGVTVTAEDPEQEEASKGSTLVQPEVNLDTTPFMIPLNRVVRTGAGTVTIQGVTYQRSTVVVSYSFQGPQGWVPPVAQSLTVGGWPLNLLSPNLARGMMSGAQGYRSASFGPRPEVAVGMEVTFGNGWEPGGDMVIPLANLRDLRRAGDRVTAELVMPAQQRVLQSGFVFMDESGRRHQAAIQAETEQDRVRFYRVEATGIPAETTLSALLASQVQRRVPGFTVKLDPFTR